MSANVTEFLKKEIQFDFNSKSLSIFRITLGLFVAFQSILRWVYFSEIYSENGLSSVQSSLTYMDFLQYDGLPHLLWSSISSDFFYLFLLAFQFLVALAFSAGVLFPFVGWVLCFLWFQFYYRGLVLSQIGDAIIFYALLWSIFLPLTRHYVFRSGLNGTRFFRQLETPFIFQFVVIFFFFALNHRHGSWQEGTAFERVMLYTSRIDWSRDWVESMKATWTVLTYVLPWLEIFIGIGVLFHRLRVWALAALLVYSVGLIALTGYWSVSLPLLILGLPFMNGKALLKKGRTLEVVEVYLAILMIIPAMAYIEGNKFREKSVVAQMDEFQRKYFFLQKWNILSAPFSEEGFVKVNNQKILEKEILKLRPEYQRFGMFFEFSIYRFWRQNFRLSMTNSLDEPIKNLICRYSQYPFARGELLVFEFPPRVSYRLEVRCP